MSELTGKQRINLILKGKDVDRSGFWLGKPHPDALRIIKKYFKVHSVRGAEVLLKSDIRWIMAGNYAFPPSTALMFKNVRKRNVRHSTSDAIVKDIKTIEDIENLNWINREKYLFPFYDRKLRTAEQDNMAVFSGGHCHIWHFLLDFFGLEECFMLMYENPELVKDVINRATNCWLKFNNTLYKKYSGRIDAGFYFNDLGTQLDSMVSVDMFREFFLPYFKKFIDQAHSFGIKCCLHSCGSIDRYIPDLINAGVDILHPIQAKAKNMGAEHLKTTYGDSLVFMGGLDAQDILPFGSPDEVRTEVKRLRDIFGNNFILSPSHEAILSNIPPENLRAMAEEATKIY
ncbi:MAG: methylcobalamin:coenzyme M methyltransferase [Firmicutes bacterium ADurb.Bin080]|nr:MAG: methylcobalamin:coenzyme M methyltransferase [Firmicutes bacterium ADurb.Bin080]